MTLSVLETVQSLDAAGISTIPTRLDGSKTPAISEWKTFQGRRPTPDELKSFFSRRAGIAAIAGAVSGGLEIIDFDDGSTFPEWSALVEEELPGILEQLSIAQTPRKPCGYHVRYRCLGHTEGNQKLAMYAPDDPIKANRGKARIETRGDGGYVIAEGSPLEVHENRTPYFHLSGPPLTDVRAISPEARAILIRSARVFDLSPQVETEKPKPTKPFAPRNDDERPGDVFNRSRPDWGPLLEPHGWTIARIVGPKTLWRRPDKSKGWSATTGHCIVDGIELFAVFSSSAHPFPGPSNGKLCSCHSPFDVLAKLNYGGKHSEAAKALAAQGWGRQTTRTATNGKPGVNGNGQAHATGGNADEPPHDDRGDAHEDEQPSHDVPKETPTKAIAAAQWPEPIPLGKLECKTPMFPTEVLPIDLAEWVIATATELQVSPDMPAMIALAICGAGMAKRVRVQVRRGWIEPSNLYVFVAADPSERKSAVMAKATKPVYKLEKEERKRLQPVLAEAETKRRQLEARIKRLEGEIAKKAYADAGMLREECTSLVVQLAAMKPAFEPQYAVDDVTPEALSQVLSRQGERIMVASAEGGIFSMACGRYSEKPNLELMLKAHCGDSYRSGRVGRENIHLDAPALTIAVFGQRDVLESLSEESQLRGRGFLARFFYSVPASFVGRRTPGMPAVPFEIEDRYEACVTRFWKQHDDAPDGDFAAVPGIVIPFSPEADALMLEFERWLEPRLKATGEIGHLAGWGGKLSGGIARLALILHVGNYGEQGDISAETFNDAIRVGRYLIDHATAAFSVIGSKIEMVDAAKILEWLREKQRMETTAAEVYREVFGSNRSVGEVNAGIDTLVSHNVLRMGPKREKELRVGRPPSPVYQVNPACLAGVN